MSADGKTVRFAIESQYDPYTAEAMALVHKITDVAVAATPNTSLAGAKVSMVGFPAVNADIQHLMVGDFVKLGIATLIIVGLILIALLRAVLAPLYLLATVVLNYAAAMGTGVLVFRYGLHHDITWPVPLLSFIILVAVGADYNMLLISRLREESANNIRVGVLRTVASTGSVITSAGLIFAASMFGLMVGSIATMVQMGFIIGCGLLLDTFVVRTLMVPAIATLLREASWWPGYGPQAARAQRSTPIQARRVSDRLRAGDREKSLPPAATAFVQRTTYCVECCTTYVGCHAVLADLRRRRRRFRLRRSARPARRTRAAAGAQALRHRPVRRSPLPCCC